MDEFLLRILVVSLAFISCLAIGGIVIVDVAGHSPQSSLGTIAGTATGALVGLLVNPNTRRKE